MRAVIQRVKAAKVTGMQDQIVTIYHIILYCSPSVGWAGVLHWTRPVRAGGNQGQRHRQGCWVSVGKFHSGDNHLRFRPPNTAYHSSVRKILALRLFEEEGKRWQKSVKDLNLELLCVSQFTLYHRLKGNKPDFSAAMKGEEAQELYNQFLDRLGQSYDSSKIKGEW